MKCEVCQSAEHEVADCPQLKQILKGVEEEGELIV